MGFILDGLETESYDRQYSDRQLLARIASYFRPHARALGTVALTLSLNSLAGTAGPILIAESIDFVAATPAVGAFVTVCALILGVGGLGWIFNYVRQKISARVIGDVVLNLREDVFTRAIHQDLSFFDEHPSGKIVSRITSDTQDFSNIITLVVDLLSQFLLVVVLSIWLFSINLWLTLLLLGLAPITAIIAISFRKLARKVSQQARRVTAKINAQIQESISGIVVAKGFRQEATIYDRFVSNNNQAYRVNLRRGIVLNMIFPILTMISGVGIGILVYAGGSAMRAGGMSPGDWYLFMQAVGFYVWPLINIASFWSQFQDGLSAAERVFALIDSEPAVRQTGSVECGRIDGRISFESVDFAYNEKEQVLEGFDLEIAAGETLAVVGHTGAGKSSLARLINRFYEFQGGRILVDGRDIRTLDLKAYRRNIGFVPQAPFLFSGSVAENIRYGRSDADEEEIAYAATHIGGGAWVKALASGLSTDVGPRGTSLSMGQRQLVALARVLLKNPSIFVLDEATASVDPFTEVQIQDGLDILMADRTTIVIAHRLSTVKNADRIIVLSKGTIIEEGTHGTLLAAGGHYAELYNSYFRHQSLEYIESFDAAASE